MANILADIKNTPLKIVLQKAYAKFKDRLNDKKKRAFDTGNPTRTNNHPNPIYHSYVSLGALNVDAISKETATFLADAYVDHRFNILGSGWVKNAHDSEAVGFEGNVYLGSAEIDNYDVYGNWLRHVVTKKHYRATKRIWTEINRLTYDYIAIDWQKDLKSGYRWDAKAWYKDQFAMSYGLPGVDIKVPFELCRLQHLPQMAILAKVLPERKDALLKEFFYQSLDFISTNPPRMGVCWSSSMEVGIRAANLLLAYDLFTQMDTEDVLDSKFKAIFANSMYDHGSHLMANLEFKESITNNHYLANICGLLYISAHLEDYPNINGWLSFAIQELVKEIDKQILPDGGNFESSTSYQRLSGEMIVYSVALIRGLNRDKQKCLADYDSKSWKYKQKLAPIEDQAYEIKDGIVFPKEIDDKIGKMIALTETISKRNGEVPQIGDNDSGRFFTLTPCGEMMTYAEAKKKYLNLNNHSQNDEDLYWDENTLDHRPFLSAGSGIVQKVGEVPLFELEKMLVFEMAKGNKTSFEQYAYVSPNRNGENLEHKQRTRISDEIPPGNSLKEGLTISTFPDLGVCVLKSNRLYLAVSFGNKHNLQYWTHTHNDKLSFELNVDGKDLIVYPGTYVYTALPEVRNEFRSVKSYNGVLVGNEEQNVWIDGVDGVFRTEGKTHCEMLVVKEDEVILSVEYNGIKHIRNIKVEADEIVITDNCNKPFELNFNRFRIYSNGYGKRLF
ncbi:MAG: alginate lyase family protein [Flavobacteriales bacterium]|nr:alginate lyase family protein [Flavobacteriales bacterium]